ncbi:uncharacterized protein E0L32_009333 [Thyridium curvatum]|uniref:Uncharacterized protein n=1 Tax=Thyridium curvatum TaxID=1093900 RepID=A0A507AHJ1_9PEZI|nr:uncharacterized protein E0L32_009333 [Thyridium curvatum]TPX09445.1 hypothetical protein E0L32_009333 [Thyridium curvatum]
MARRRRSPGLQSSLGCLLLLASTASALSLSNFQLIASSSVPLGCILAYNQPLEECSASDFAGGNQCSRSCQRSILKTQRTLQGVCVDVSAPTNTVLGQALKGNLLNVLCGGNGDESNPKPGRPSATSTVAAPPSSTASNGGRTRSTSASSSSQADAISSTIDISSSTTTLSQPSQSSPAPAQTTSPSPQRPTDTTGAQQTRRPSPSQPRPNRETSGSSPFEAAAQTDAAPELTVHWRQAVFMALSVGILLAR